MEFAAVLAHIPMAWSGEPLSAISVYCSMRNARRSAAGTSSTYLPVRVISALCSDFRSKNAVPEFEGIATFNIQEHQIPEDVFQINGVEGPNPAMDSRASFRPNSQTAGVPWGDWILPTIVSGLSPS